MIYNRGESSNVQGQTSQGVNRPGGKMAKGEKARYQLLNCKRNIPTECCMINYKYLNCCCVIDAVDHVSFL